MSEKQLTGVLVLYGSFLAGLMLNIISLRDFVFIGIGLMSCLHMVLRLSKSDKDDDKPQPECETKPQ